MQVEGMLEILVLLLVTSKSYQSDVALMLGSDFDFIIYTSHLNRTSECLDHLTITYPGTFTGPISAVFLVNIGVFLCGGSTSNKTQVSSKQC